jgi:hypothetical protein
VQDLRGNVDTRLRKVAEGEVDAAVLAAAGLARLGVSPANATPLPLTVMVPAPGQGCLALQCRGEDEAAREALAPLDHAESHAALDAERSVMWRLGGGCALPLGAYAEPIDGGLRVTAVIATARRQRDPAGGAVGGDARGRRGPRGEGSDRRRRRADPRRGARPGDGGGVGRAHVLVTRPADQSSELVKLLDRLAPARSWRRRSRSCRRGSAALTRALREPGRRESSSGSR